MSDAAQSTRIRSMRPVKPSVDPWRPLEVLIEQERRADGVLRDSMTVFLAGAECPFTCVFCDLWRFTLDGPTPDGAIPRQIELALESVDRAGMPEAIKLYNASNFFDPKAVPPVDLPRIADLLEGFERVTVECHPRLLGQSCFGFAESLAGDLEVAMGLETVHPQALSQLNKQMTLSDFARATDLLHDNDIGVRSFVLLSPPFVPPQESIEWTVRSVEFAVDRGADVVAVIPTRVGSGELERLAALGLFASPTLAMLEQSLRRVVESPGTAVLADLWDADKLSACPACQEDRLSSLREMNRTGRITPMVSCSRCSAGNGGEA